jgi:ribosomal protein S18 acetylase RimI-like enzyme
MPDMLVKLYDLAENSPLIEQVRQDGFLVRRAMAYEKHLVVRWVQRAFSNRWASECDVAFSHQPISCYLATSQSKIVGFGCYDVTCKSFFGPVGVAEHARGNKIGTALLLACLQAMRAEGYAYAIIGAAGAPEFYAKVVGAIEIPDSTPSIWRDMLPDEDIG